MKAPQRKRGQGMTEYVIIVAVVAILSIVIVVAFGNQIRGWFWAAGTQLSGNENATVSNEMGNDYKRGLGDMTGSSDGSP